LNRFVLDASTALSWCFEDEHVHSADRILDTVASSEVLVPAFWPMEVGNALLAGERRKRITPAGISRSMELLGRLGIQIDNAPMLTTVAEWITLARAERLAVYDAAYLALAMREGIPLATLDRAMVRAAGRLKVPVMD